MAEWFIFGFSFLDRKSNKCLGGVKMNFPIGSEFFIIEYDDDAEICNREFIQNEEEVNERITHLTGNGHGTYIDKVLKVKVLDEYEIVSKLKSKTPTIEWKNIPVKLQCPHPCDPRYKDGCVHSIPHLPVGITDNDSHNCSIGYTICDADNLNVTCKPV